MKKVKKTKDHKYLYSFFFLVLLMVITFIILFNNYELANILEIIKKADLIFILLGFLLFFNYLFFEALSIKTLLGKLDCKTSLLSSIKYSVIDFYFCAITPSALGGQPMSIYYMNKDKIPVRKSTVALLINSSIYRTVLLIYGIVILIFFRQDICTNNNLFNILLIVGYIINTFIIVLFFLGLFSKKLIKALINSIINILTKLKLIKRDRKVIDRYFEMNINQYNLAANYVSKHSLTIIKVFIFNLIQRGSLFIIGYMIYRALGFNTATIIQLFAISVLIAIAVDTLPIPGGMGLSENLMIMLYSAIYAKETAVSAMLLTRGINYYFAIAVTSILFIGVELIKITKYKRKKVGQK